MGALSITNGDIVTNKGSMPSIDHRYGPYASVAAAHAALAEDELCTVGLTVGIIDGNNIVEYWYQGGTAQANLVPKQSGGGVAAPEVVDISDAAVNIASLQGNKVYRCTASGGVTSLTVTAFDSATAELEAVIELTTASNFTTLSLPATSRYAPAKPILQPSTSYVMSCKGGIWAVSPVVSA